MKKTILVILSILILISCLIFFGNSRSNNYYDEPIREVDQLSDEYYLGPTIDENNSKISNIKYYEYLDGITSSASPIGYYIQFDYKENEIDCEIAIHSKPLEEYEGDIDNSNVYLYKEHEIYLWEFIDEERNIVSKSSIAVLGDFVCLIEISPISLNDDNLECIKEISLELMYELIDEYIERQK